MVLLVLLLSFATFERQNIYDVCWLDATEFWKGLPEIVEGQAVFSPDFFDQHFDDLGALKTVRWYGKQRKPRTAWVNPVQTQVAKPCAAYNVSIARMSVTRGALMNLHLASSQKIIPRGCQPAADGSRTCYFGRWNWARKEEKRRGYNPQKISTIHVLWWASSRQPVDMVSIFPFTTA